MSFREAWSTGWNKIRGTTIFVLRAPDGRVRAGWRALLYVPVTAALLFSSQLVVLLLVPSQRLTSDWEFGVLVSGFLTVPSTVVAAYLLLRLADKRSFRTLGFWFYDGWGREVTAGLAGGLAMISAVVGLLALSGQVELRAGPLDILVALRGVGWVFLLLLPAAAAEEFVFRGYPFQRLVEAWGAFWAVFLLSVLFGLGHWNNPAATPLSTANTVLIGIFLAAAYLKTRGLWFPIGLHFAWNFSLGFIYSLPVSGFVLSQKLLVAEIGGPAWLSGGNYGPEGSVLTAVLTLAAIVWLARTRRLGVSPALAPYLTSDGTGLAKELQ